MFNFEMVAGRVLWKKREMFINVSLNKKIWRSYQFYSVKTLKGKNKINEPFKIKLLKVFNFEMTTGRVL